jgi:hypothetical protein
MEFIPSLFSDGTIILVTFFCLTFLLVIVCVIGADMLACMANPLEDIVALDFACFASLRLFGVCHGTPEGFLKSLITKQY